MRRNFILCICLALYFIPACSQSKKDKTMSEENDKSTNEFKRVVKTDTEWKEELDPETYRITREKGTERAFTGKYYKFDENGVYDCSNCGNPLFRSEHKYESGSGWPSFYTVYGENSIKEIKDDTFGMSRTEIVCKRCDAHLGHVFEDGPQPTGMRYCINSPSLEFEKSDTSKGK